MKLKALIGSGDKIGLFTLPFLLLGVILNVKKPSFSKVGGSPKLLRTISLLMLLPGVVIWLWSVMLILINVPQNKLITHGPYALMKHPLYTSVALLVLPGLGFLFDTWLGSAVGIILYVGSRLFSPEEEAHLSEIFGDAWDAYCKKVKLPWL